MATGHALFDKLHASGVEGTLIVLWVVAQRRMLGITIEEAIHDYIDAGQMDPSNFDRLRKLYDRRSAGAAEVYDFDGNRCANCSEQERASMRRGRR